MDEDEADGDEDDAEDEPQQRADDSGVDGLRFQVPDDLESFTVTASWGTYETVDRGTEDKPVVAGTSARRSRSPARSRSPISDAARPRIPLRDTICLRVDRYDDPDAGCRLIEIALCNDRETPMQIPIEAWMFQTKLCVTPAHARCSCRSDDAGARLGRARRRGAAAQPAVPQPAGVRDRPDLLGGLDGRQGARRATAVWTTWLPVCETPQVTADESSGALLDMNALAKRPRPSCGPAWSPIVDATRPGSTAGGLRAAQLPEHLRARGPGGGRRGRARRSGSSRTGWSTCSPTPRRCAASGS